MPLFCDICESNTHVKGRCPLLKKAKNVYDMTCGYAVHGLGFYYIPHSAASSLRQKHKRQTAIIHVVDGVMNATEVTSEMERLVPRKMKWVVEEVDKNMFNSVFPTKCEMQCMIEWGMVQTKDRKTKLAIEEWGGGSNIKQVMRKVWVQMTRLPSELQDFLVSQICNP
jgi:hypothetical protein